MERIKSIQYLSHPPPQLEEDDSLALNSINPSFTSSPSSNNNQSSSVISPTDQRMNALNDQQTADAAAAAVLTTSSPPRFSTSHTTNYNNDNTSNQIRNVQQEESATMHNNALERTPLLYIQPPHSVTSDPPNLQINPSLFHNEQNEGRPNLDEGDMEGCPNIVTNAIA